MHFYLTTYNGGSSVIDRSFTYIYRGMPIGKDDFGHILYSSGRDIGNMSAGIVAAKMVFHGVSPEVFLMLTKQKIIWIITGILLAI